MAKRQYTSTIASAVEEFGQGKTKTTAKKETATKKTPAEKADVIPKETAPSKTEKAITEESVSTRKQESAVKKTGRPKGEDLVHVSLGIPSRLHEQINGAALLHGGNKTKYIVSLIEADIKKNGKTYSNLASMVNDARL